MAALLTATAASGCKGCRPFARRQLPDIDKLDEEKEKLKPKEDFELRRLNTLPHALTGSETYFRSRHWISGTVEAVANNFDFQGQLKTEPVDLVDQPFRLRSTRSAALPKAQKKQVELVMYAPAPRSPEQLDLDLTARRSERSLLKLPFPLKRLGPHQYLFLVLSGEPDRYQYLRGLDTFTPQAGTIVDFAESPNFLVLLPLVERRAPLPSSLTYCTTLAAVLWDDFDPSILTPQQQEALIDWLHFGGQLVVSGPASLDRLGGSFLEPWLPCDAGESVTLTTDDLAELSRAWSIKDAPLTTRRPWTAVRLAPRDGAETLAAQGEAPLVVERRVGRGRVVVSSFRLAQRDLLAWPGYDSFWNGCLLRRPPRQFEVEPGVTYRVTWADQAERGRSINLPQRISSLRFLSRHAGWTGPASEGTIARQSAPPPVPPPGGPINNPFNPAPPPPLADWDELMQAPAVADWSDQLPIAQAAVGALRAAAGIDVPDKQFVLQVLGGYLLVLVPLNWLVFRALGRLEWAWVAVPIEAMGFAILVTRLAQLDIGFVRARTEIGVVEMHAGYSRAHVTRYAALYTSLSTRYACEFDDPSGVALPMSTGGALLRGQGRSLLEFQREPQPSLRGLTVASNSLGMIHAEHLADVGGAFALSPDGSQVVNQTAMPLEDVAVVGPEGLAVVGELAPGATATLDFGENTPTARARARIWNPAPATERTGALSVDAILELAAGSVEPGEVRLVGVSRQQLDGLQIQPVASQERVAHVVVAHLRPGNLPEMQRDLNGRPAELKRPDVLEYNAADD